MRVPNVQHARKRKRGRGQRRQKCRRRCFASAVVTVAAENSISVFRQIRTKFNIKKLRSCPHVKSTVAGQAVKQVNPWIAEN